MKVKLISVFIFFLSSAGMFAESLNLEQARALALANSRSMARHNMAIRSSLLDERNHILSMLPSPSAGYTVSASYLNRDWAFENPLDTYNAGLTFSITQKLFEGGKNFLYKAINAISTENARKDALSEYFTILDTADNAYYAVLEAEANLEAAESSLKTADISYSIAQIRHQSGVINYGDYLRALTDKEAKENTRNQARRSLALAKTRLNAVIGITDFNELEKIDFTEYEKVMEHLAGISDEDTIVIYDRFWGILAASNPSLAKAHLNTQRAEKNLSITKRDLSPTISATIFSTTQTYTAKNGYSNSAYGGFTLSGTIPIDFWITASKIEKSKIARDSALLDYKNTEISLETELQSALLNTFAQAESTLSSRRSLEYAERHFDFVMERYRLSQSSVSDVSEASALLITAQNNLTRSSYGFLQSLSKLRSLGAIDEEKYLVNILMGES